MPFKKQASFASLPAELRQQILLEAFDAGIKKDIIYPFNLCHILEELATGREAYGGSASFINTVQLVEGVRLCGTIFEDDIQYVIDTRKDWVWALAKAEYDKNLRERGNFTPMQVAR